MSKFIISILGLVLCTGQLSAQVSRVGTKKVVMNINGSILKIPYYSNYPLDETNDEINSAVVTIHGTGRNADDYYYSMRAAASMRPEQTDSSVIIAPQFITEEDIDYLSLDNEHLYWSSGGWKSGSNSLDNVTNPRPERIPSYAVLDTVILRLYQNYPNLKTIVITGHSAGGQFVNRFAATSAMISILGEQYNLKIKIIVANPSSYVYFDNRRVLSGTIDQFEIPDNSCPGYNEWKYGLDDLYTYPSRIGVDSIRNTYRTREVVYILGGNDTDPNSSSLDISCEAMLQGHHRLERGTIYFNYLLDYYGDDLHNYQAIDTIPGVGHNSLGMYSSDIGLCHLFELDKLPYECSNPTTSITGFAGDFDVSIYPNPSSGNITIRLGQNARYDHIRLEIYSILGNRIRVYNNQTEINLNNFTPGTYILKIETDNITKIEKIILMD